MRIFLTGGTGFLGSHLAEALLLNHYELMVSRRASSKMENCELFVSSVRWIDTDKKAWEDEVIKFKPEVIIHAAWGGIISVDRGNWEQQLTNIDFVCRLLEIATIVGVKKIILLGSQAEYGKINGSITENEPVCPDTSYGATKLCVQRMVQSYCETSNIVWYWFRVFSVFGERQSSSWFIPSLITKLLKGEQPIGLTLGEQEYAYLYVADFAEAIVKTIMSESPSGIYNISSPSVLRLREMGDYIKNEINPTLSLRWGALPYRKNQSMCIAGDMSKYTEAFGPVVISDWKDSLKKVINWYKSK